MLSLAGKNSLFLTSLSRAFLTYKVIKDIVWISFRNENRSFLKISLGKVPGGRGGGGGSPPCQSEFRGGITYYIYSQSLVRRSSLRWFERGDGDGEGRKKNGLFLKLARETSREERKVCISRATIGGKKLYFFAASMTTCPPFLYIDIVDKKRHQGDEMASLRCGVLAFLLLLLCCVEVSVYMMKK